MISNNSIARALASLVILAGAIAYKISTIQETLSPVSSLSSNTGQGPATPGWIDIYYTDPSSMDGQNESVLDLQNALLAAIDAARLSVDIAIYSLDLPKIRQAVVDAQRRGVAVRLVTESDNLEHAELQALQTAGVALRGDDAAGLMHNKFVVIDRLEVWTGSMNLTYPSVYQDNNNLVRVRSPELAQDYLAEFEEMFLRGCFGAGPATSDACSITPYPRLTLDDTALEVYFSPDDGVAARLVELITDAQKSIYFLAYTITAEDIAEAMLGRARAGVKVAGVFEDSQIPTGLEVDSVYGLMRTAGLDVHLDGNPGNMHHKVIILDGKTVITGSYNFSRNAETRNDENVLILHNPQIAAAYLAEFKHIYTEARP